MERRFNSIEDALSDMTEKHPDSQCMTKMAVLFQSLRVYYDPNQHIVTMIGGPYDEDGTVYLDQFPARDIILNQDIYEALNGRVDDFNPAGNNAEVLAALDEVVDIYVQSETSNLVESNWQYGIEMGVVNRLEREVRRLEMRLDLLKAVRAINIKRQLALSASDAEQRAEVVERLQLERDELKKLLLDFHARYHPFE